MNIKDNLEDQLDDIEKSYRKLIADIEDQLNEMEKRLSEALDDVQAQLPDEAADAMARMRDMNDAARKRLVRLSDNALEAAKDAIDAIVDAGGRLRGKSTEATRKVSKSPTKKSSTKPASSSGTPPGKANSKWTKAQLEAEARRLDIAGRSSMNKAQLVRAINAA